LVSCVVYDVARKDTFESLGMWLQEVEQFSMGGGKEVVKLLVGNKVDQERVVTRQVAIFRGFYSVVSSLVYIQKL
jgi:Ras-related protein Rab-18